jgi:signal transduction histidine kinase
LLRLHQIYFKKFILLFVILFTVIGFVTYFWLKSFYIEQTKESLLQNIKFISYNINKNININKFVKTIKDDLKIRVTIMAEDGNIIAESNDAKNIRDNHKYREEFIQSNTQEFGSMIRRSYSANIDLLYVVKKLKIDNNIYYIRLAKELPKINKEIFSLAIQVTIILIIFFILLFYSIHKTNKDVQNEINNISKFLLNLTKKSKSSYITSEFSQEFEQITSLLAKVSKILIKKDKQKSKYTAKLQSLNEQKDHIISAISHEFKNPIAVINGYCQTLIDDPNMNKKIQDKFLKKIYKNGIRLSELIDTLRLSIKLDEKKQPINLVDVNLYNIIQDACESLQSNYKNREVQIIGDKNITILADKTLLSVAIINLIENAIKYSEDKVSVKFDNKSIKVIDTGVGISKNDIEQITDKFYRVSSNGWDNSLGLGLSIVSNIISMHNFNLQIQSVENNGSTFEIVFKN